MRVLVTGGAGFVGSHFVERLVAEGHDVIVVDDLSTGKLENLQAVRSKIKFVKRNVNDYRDLLTLVDDGVDVIAHLAARLGVEAVLNDPGAQFENVLGIQNVLQVAEHRRCRVLFTSTSSVYGDQTPPFHEDMPLLLKPDTISSYACAKLMGEYQCKAFAQSGAVPTCVVRLFNMSGPRAATSGPYSFVLQRFVKAALANEDIVVYGSGKQTRSFSYVGDGALILERLLHCPVFHKHSGAFSGDPINIGSSEETSIIDLANLVRTVTDSSSKIVFRPYPVNFTDYRRRQPDCRRLQSHIGWKPMKTLTEIILLTAESLKTKPAPVLVEDGGE